MLQKVLTAALHAANVAFSLSDLRGEDAPLVWISEGFSRINEWSRSDAIGRNCRFLQSDASDFGTIRDMSRAVSAREHCRVYLWNQPLKGNGFWSIISLSPGRGNDATEGDMLADYMMGVQFNLSKENMRFVFDRVLAYRLAFWEDKEATAPPISPLLPPLPCHAPLPSPAAAPAHALPPPPAPVTSPAPPPPIAIDGLGGVGEVKAALAVWELEFTQQHSRRPSPEEVTSMVLEAYASLAPPAQVD